MNRLPALVLCLGLAAGARAQDPHAPKAPEVSPGAKEGGELIPVPVPATSDDDLHAEMQRLIGAVELRLRQIDKLLAEAGSGRRAARDASGELAKAVEDIGALVKRSQEESQEVVRSIDKILELADHEHPPGGA